MDINQSIEVAIKRARREVILDTSYIPDVVAAADYVYEALGKTNSYEIAVKKMFTK